MNFAKIADPDEWFKRFVMICDAKSLYDHIHSDIVGISNDVRVAIEIQIIRDSHNS